MEIIKIYLIFSMLATIYYDIRHYIIPNWLVGSLFMIYPVMLWLSPDTLDWSMALVGMAIVFAVGYGVFAKGWMGAGDIKFITVCSLWVGFSQLLEFIFLFAIFGGVLSIVLLFGRKPAAFLAAKMNIKTLPRVLQEKEPVPYGIAIAIALLAMIFKGNIPGIAL